jgi:cell division septum initiation protein DivIVA
MANDNLKKYILEGVAELLEPIHDRLEQLTERADRLDVRIDELTDKVDGHTASLMKIEQAMCSLVPIHFYPLNL